MYLSAQLVQYQPIVLPSSLQPTPNLYVSSSPMFHHCFIFMCRWCSDDADTDTGQEGLGRVDLTRGGQGARSEETYIHTYWLIDSRAREDPTPYFSNQYNIIYKYTKIIAIVGSLRQQTDTVRSCLSSYVHIYDKSKISILSNLAILESILPNVNISIHSRTKPDM